jgi:osmoprotectant transport system permease protein
VFAPAAVVALEDPWVRWDWLDRNLDLVARSTVQHLQLTVAALVLGLLIALPLGLAAHRWKRIYPPVLGVAGVIYSIPSLALLVLLIPFSGISTTTALIPLVLYSLLMLLRNVVTGLGAVPPDVVEAARGMGYSSGRLLLRVELPLAVPAIVAGVRIASVTTIGLVTITALVGQPSLGSLILNDGLYRDFRTPVVVGSVLIVALASVADLALAGLQRWLTPWSRRAA